MVLVEATPEVRYTLSSQCQRPIYSTREGCFISFTNRDTANRREVVSDSYQFLAGLSETFPTAKPKPWLTGALSEVLWPMFFHELSRSTDIRHSYLIKGANLFDHLPLQ